MILIPPDINYFGFLGLNIHYYSVCIFFAVILSFFFAYYGCGRFFLSVDKNVLSDLTPSLIIYSIIGARLYYVLLSLDYFISNPLAVFMIWQGGLSIHGAFLGGVIFGLLYMKKKKLNFFPYADIVSLVLPLGQAIGRWGNFFNQEAFGVPVNNSHIALYVKESLRPLQFKEYEYFHPCFLYESILDFLIFIILFFTAKKISKKFDGVIFFLYILLYSIVRAVIEPFRLDTIFYIKNIPFPVIVSVIGILTGITGIFIRIKKGKESIF